ncbi:MAG TPA: hypothetical protein VNA69_17195 [Thermoanaerobaculia bacterium]|nr:hypothetical protein [Thermoanaerobaculia bacterium]
MIARTAAALIAALVVSAATAECVERATPLFIRELSPADGFAYTNDVAWLPNGHLLIGARDGVTEYSPSGGTSERVISGGAVPAGLPMVQGLDTDGATVVAFNMDYGDIAFDLAGKRVLRARRHPAFQIFDLAVRGRTVVVLGRPLLLKNAGYGVLWIGEAGAPWESFRVVRTVDGAAADLVRKTLPPYGGGVQFASDGTIAIITPAEAGVLRYKADGTPLAALGRHLDELVVRRLPEVVKRYGADLTGRYQEILNHQPLADDLIETSDGLAIVVRQWADGEAWWELWFPDANAARRRVRLASDRRPIGGHMRCDGFGRMVACLFDRFVAADKPSRPHLAMYDLAAVKRDASCR